MKPLDKFRLKIKVLALGDIVWNMLIFLSKITLITFILITCLVFWMNVANTLYQLGINLSKPIKQMFLMVFISLFFISIDYIKNLKWRKEKDERDK